jgi:2-polyprenyl-6-methoxyphenol hydroxylase-like FAD-dependent oxidoreductase
MGGSVGPKVGPTYIVVGDAAGSVNPFNGEGIDYAYETARMAAEVIGEAITTGNAAALMRYQTLIDDEYGQYFKVARLFARIIGRPALMRELPLTGRRRGSPGPSRTPSHHLSSHPGDQSEAVRRLRGALHTNHCVRREIHDAA